MTSTRLISSLYTLLDEYEATVRASLLSPSSQTDYIMFAEQFVRWVEGDFVPGATLEMMEGRNGHQKSHR